LAVLGATYEFDPEVAMVLTAIEATAWLADYLPKVWSCLDDPQNADGTAKCSDPIGPSWLRNSPYCRSPEGFG
jgi:hypothetical protein